MSILNCENLSKAFGRKVVLNNVNLSIEKGRIVGLLGPNGSGKTTLIKIINTLLVPDCGSVRVDGLELGIETKGIVSYLPDRECLPDWMSVEELIQFYCDFYEDFSKEKAERMIESLNINIKEKFRKLSKGTREKVQLILVMSRNAKLYLLDEPIGGVDPVTRDYILSSIIASYNEEATVVIATHLINDVEKILDEVVFIKAGEIILHDSVDNIREEHNMSIDEKFREVFR
ncbi:MAG: ABC transporter ATP-binding protein [Clostridia bacterium]|nr:ABC transporter ATP-binding protein [Clostridia bacterium]